MKSSPTRFFDFRLLAACALFCFCAPASAVTIDWVTVGNAGNAGEITGTAAGSIWPTAVVGNISYEYKIGKYEVTNSQYVEFLNNVDATGANSLGLYSPGMNDDPRGGIVQNLVAANGSKYSVKSGQQDNPVVYIDFYDAVRFTNWVNNDGGTNTETGAYTLLGGTAVPSNAATLTRNPDAKVFLPTESEWYKAAYHKNDGATGNYWDYATRTDVPAYSDNPLSINTPDATNTANVFAVDLDFGNGYDDGFAVSGFELDLGTNLLTNVGAYGLAVGPYGTFDQGGNVKEWNETLIIDGFGMHRGISGGSWSTGSDAVGATVRFFGNPVDNGNTYDNIGFRLGGYFSVVDPGPGGGGGGEIPEPSTLLLACCGALALLKRQRTKRSS